MVEPTHFGHVAGVAAGAASGPVQRRLRKMSGHPEEPRVFSQAKILIGIGLPLSILMTLVMYFPISEYLAGDSDDIFSVIVPACFTAMIYVLFAHGALSSVWCGP